jgi:hypothetical protein
MLTARITLDKFYYCLISQTFGWFPRVLDIRYNRKETKMPEDAPKTELEKVIEKVRLLQRLAGNNPNENEVIAAMAKADKYIRAYQLSQAQLEEVDSSKAEGFVKKKVCSQSKRAAWVEAVIRCVCAHYGCTFYLDTSPVPVPAELQEFNGGRVVVSAVQYVVVGKRSDVEIVDYTATFLIKYGKVISELQSKGKGVAYARSFLEGFGIGVSQKFAALKEEERLNAIQSTAMVLLNNRAIEARNWLHSEMGRMGRAARISGSSSNSEGRSAGIVAGRNASVNRALK